MPDPDSILSDAFRIQVAFGDASQKERREEIGKLYPDKTEAQLKQMQRDFDSAESTAWALSSTGRLKMTAEEMKAELTERYPWMTEDAQGLVEWRARYYDWHR
jgi:hypothetical protein